MRISGRCVSTLGRTPWALSRKRSHTASLILSAAKLRDCNGLCCAVTSTLILCRGVNHISQATAIAARNKSCSVRYSVWLSCTNTRCARRLCRLSCITARQEPRTITPPRCRSTSCADKPVMVMTSAVNHSSTPAAQSKNNTKEFITSFATMPAQF